MTPSQGTLLSKINSPYDLRQLPVEELPGLCLEIRQFILEVISKNPGHLGASLGVVELTTAIHYVFNTPDDKLIWDVGHQAYAHKILTGRKDVFYTNRTYKGISGFPRRTESEYDAFGTGHSSTSISAALGMAVASALSGNRKQQHIAVIGDGSMTGGMAMEALNNAGVSKANLLVILNDNGIAIDKNVGGLSNYLTDITTSRTYNRLRDKIWVLMGGKTRYGANSRAVVKQFGNAVKSTLLKESNLFEAFGFRYFGPVDGHDVVRLAHLMKDLKNIPGPKLLHIVTTKGKGFERAEKEQTLYHAPGQFDRETGVLKETQCQNQPPKYQVVFGKTIIELAEQNEKIVGVTPAMPTGCSLNMMMAKMPHRAFDVGIAEQHAVTFSAGMAARGLIPFCNIYSTFMQRAYDQLIHDVALQKLNVVFCLDRGGLVGEDGATHHGVYDLAYLRAIPNLTICSPMDELELRNMMYTAQLPGMGPFAIRYPRGRGMSPDWKKPFEALTVGKGRKIRDGKDLAIITIGHSGNYALSACEILMGKGIDAALFDIRFLKPIDEDLLLSVFRNFKKVITVEDGTILGGLGSAVIEFANDHGFSAEIHRLGVPDRFIEQGTLEELHRECGFDVEGIVEAGCKLNSEVQ
ncbi:MAG: 1-deoxy-D-xylulose-5-phosphate synthase [Bacteroidales bacterium]|nr:1-deoxy-D-xylulose-5-phosphate synthase [Bacteroidales bacterium]